MHSVDGAAQLRRTGNEAYMPAVPHGAAECQRRLKRVCRESLPRVCLPWACGLQAVAIHRHASMLLAVSKIVHVSLRGTTVLPESIAVVRLDSRTVCVVHAHMHWAQDAVANSTPE